MKLSILISFMLWSFTALSQDPCLDKILSTPGRWGKFDRTERVSATELPLQKKFINAVNTALEENYKPRHIQADRSAWHEPLDQSRPVASYGLTLYGMQYSCKGAELVLDHETSTKMMIGFNKFTDAEIYELSTDNILTGFHRLGRGLPVEVKPGIWQFPDQRASLGFGVDGNSKAWLMTHDGKLPWAYVTRSEFLLKRKKILEQQKAEQAPRLQEQLEKWNLQKRYMEQESKNDAQKLATFINGTYNPGVEREKANHDRVMGELTKAIERVNEQLKAPAVELSKKAIVVRSQQNANDYDFVEKVEPLAEILVKPNPSYFNRTLGRSVPQFVNVEIIVNPKDSVAARFARDAESAVNFDYLKSFIGKTTPGASPGESALPKSQSTNSTTPPTKASSQASSSASIASLPASTATGNSVKSNGANAVSTKNENISGKTFLLSGTLSGPVASSVTLGYNGGNEITVTPTKKDQSVYTSVPMRFTKPIADGSEFNIELRKVPPGMKGVVYRGSGKAPNDVENLLVAVDYTYDLVTRSTGDKTFTTFYESYTPAVGGYNGEEGRYVVFSSLTKNFEGSDGKHRQIYWRDRNTGITKLISRSATGEIANGDCYEPTISADGQTVVFESKATNLTPADNNNVKDIFVWLAYSNSIELVSIALNGTSSDAESFDAMLSGNGQHVVFTSSAGNLTSISKGRSISNIFVRDLKSKKTEMVSVDPVQKTGGNGHKPSISFDGSRISFCSASNTLVPNDNNNYWDIFLWQRGNVPLKRVSLTHDGKERNAGVESASRQVSSTLSGNGRFVAFATTATNMIPGDNNTFQDVFVVDVENGKVSVASFADDGQASNGDSPIEQGERIAISYDGTWVAFPTKATNLGAQGSNVILYNTVTGKKQTVSNVGGSYVGRPSISYSGGYVVFGKSANLDDRFQQSGIFAHFTGAGPCRDCRD